MAVSTDAFRAAFPVFRDRVRYPEELLAIWLPFCIKQLDAGRWGDLYDMGAYLLLAHHVVLESQQKRTAAYGKTPGLAQGVVSSKSVDGVSVSYDNSTTSEEGAGQFNLTTYGQRYAQLRRMLGAGPVYVGGEGAPVLTGAWPGPFVF